MRSSAIHASLSFALALSLALSLAACSPNDGTIIDDDTGNPSTSETGGGDTGDNTLDSGETDDATCDLATLGSEPCGRAGGSPCKPCCVAADCGNRFVEFCNNNVCFGTECREHADCNERLAYCSKGYCRTHECVDASDCGPGQDCSYNKCWPPVCATDDDCRSHELCDTASKLCRPRWCRNASDCAPGQFCGAHGCYTPVGNTSCASDDDCGFNEYCDPTLLLCRSQSPICGPTEFGACDFGNGECEADEDCAVGQYCLFAHDACECGACTPYCTSDESCSDERVCDRATGLCTACGCTSDTQCGAGYICAPPAENGCRACERNASTPAVTCSLTTTRVTLAPGGKSPIGTLAFDNDGSLLGGASLQSATSDDSIVRTDDDLVIHAENPGTATVVVTTTRPDIDNPANTIEVACGTVNVTVLAPPTTGKLVAVLDYYTGAPVADATVLLGSGDAAETCTPAPQDAFACTAETGDLHATAPGYDGVSFIAGTPASVAVIHLMPLPAPNPKSRSTVPTSDAQGDFLLGFGGASFIEPLFDLNPIDVFSPRTEVFLTCEAFGQEPEPLSLAAGLFLDWTAICNDTKPSIIIDQRPGIRAFWAVGGRGFINDVLPRMLELVSKFGEVGDLLAPLTLLQSDGLSYAGFGGLLPSANDPLANDASLPSINLDNPRDTTALITLPDLPSLPANRAGPAPDGVLAIWGARHPALGFIPLGVGMGLDDPNYDGNADLVIDPAAGSGPELPRGTVAVSLNTHPDLAHDDGYALLTIAGPIVELTRLLFAAGATDLRNLSVRVQRFDKLMRDIDAIKAGPFMPLARPVTYNPATRTADLTTTFTATASFHRVVLDGAAATSRWKVYLPRDTNTFTLPALAAGFGSSAAEVHAESISVEGDFTPATMLDAAAAKPLTRINDFITDYAR